MLRVLKAHDAIRRYGPEPCETPAGGKSMHKILSDLRVDLSPTIKAIHNSPLESELAKANDFRPVDVGGKSHASYVVGVVSAGLLDYTAALWGMREESLKHGDEFAAVVFSGGKAGLPELDLETFAKNWPAIAKRIAVLPRLDTRTLRLELRGERFRFQSQRRPRAKTSELSTEAVEQTSVGANEQVVLECLRQNAPGLTLQADIAEATHLSDNTVRETVGMLHEKSLIHRPQRVRDGWTLTQTGTETANLLRQPKS